MTKRFFGGWLATPEGWPERSPMLRSTISGYRNLWLCSKYLTPKYRAYLRHISGKQVFHLRSRADIARFLARVERGAA